jgi:hypothetical protein
MQETDTPEQLVINSQTAELRQQAVAELLSSPNACFESCSRTRHRTTLTSPRPWTCRLAASGQLAVAYSTGREQSWPITDDDHQSELASGIGPR